MAWDGLAYLPISDVVWAKIQPLLPVLEDNRPRGCHRKRVPSAPPWTPSSSRCPCRRPSQPALHGT